MLDHILKPAARAAMLKLQTLSVGILLMPLQHHILPFSSRGSNWQPPAVMSSTSRRPFHCLGVLKPLWCSCSKPNALLLYFILIFSLFAWVTSVQACLHTATSLICDLASSSPLKKKKKKQQQCARKQGQQEACSVSSAGCNVRFQMCPSVVVTRSSL